MTEKNRKTAFTAIAVITSIITIWIAAGYGSMIAAPLINTDGIGDINIDGSDWTLIFKAGAGLLNFIITAAFIALMIIAELIVTLVTWIVFRCVAFKKNPTSSQEELSYSWRVFLISTFGSLAAALAFMIVFAIRAKSGAPLSGLMFCWLNPLLMRVFYISKLKSTAV